MRVKILLELLDPQTRDDVGMDFQNKTWFRVMP